ncbi:MAG: TadE/TadG family type IV pilus assembly protein, partial [Gemmatimonadota bacterium]
RGRHAAEDSGQALVELALALPLLLLILVGIFEFARAYSMKQSIVNAAREGARTAVVQTTPNQTAVDSVINLYLSSNNISADSISIEITAPDGTTKAFDIASAGDAVSVIVSDRYEFILLGPIVGLVTGGSFRSGVDLRSRATMRKE